MYRCVYVDGWMDGWIDVCMHVYMYISIYVYMYINLCLIHTHSCIHTNTSTKPFAPHVKVKKIECNFSFYRN